MLFVLDIEKEEKTVKDLNIQVNKYRVDFGDNLVFFNLHMYHKTKYKLYGLRVRISESSNFCNGYLVFHIDVIKEGHIEYTYWIALLKTIRLLNINNSAKIYITQ